MSCPASTSDRVIAFAIAQALPCGQCRQFGG